MAMIKCPECGKEISDKATTCPNCGAPIGTTSQGAPAQPDFGQYNGPAQQPPKKKKKHRGLVVLAVIVVLIIIIIAAANSGSKSESDSNVSGTPKEAESTDSNETSSSDEQETVAVGQTYDNDGLKITYANLDLNYKDYNEFQAPSDGKKYIAATFTYENTGDSDKYVDIYEFDCYADNTTAEQAYISDDNFINTNLSAGRNVTFTVFFEVPQDAQSIELEYQPSFWSDKKVIFAVQ